MASHCSPPLAALLKISFAVAWSGSAGDGLAAGHVYVPDDINEPRRLLPSPVWHFEREELALAHEIGEGRPGKIWATRKSEWLPNNSHSANQPRKPIVLKPRSQSSETWTHVAFDFPLYAEGRLQAVLEFFSTTRQLPDKHLLYIVEALRAAGRVLERQRDIEQ